MIKNIIQHKSSYIALIMFFFIPSYGMFKGVSKIPKSGTRSTTRVTPRTFKNIPSPEAVNVPEATIEKAGKNIVPVPALNPAYISSQTGTKGFNLPTPPKTIPPSVPLQGFQPHKKIIAQPQLTLARTPLYEALVSDPKKIASAIQEILLQNFSVYLISSDALSFVNRLPIRPLEWIEESIDNEPYSSSIQSTNNNIITLARSENPILYLIIAQKPTLSLEQYKDLFHIPHTMPIQVVANNEETQKIFSNQLRKALILTEKDISLRQEINETIEKELGEKEAEVSTEQKKPEAEQDEEALLIKKAQEAENNRLIQERLEAEKKASEEKEIDDLFDQFKAKLEKESAKALETFEQQLLQEDKKIDEQAENERQNLLSQFNKEKENIQEQYKADINALEKESAKNIEEAKEAFQKTKTFIESKKEKREKILENTEKKFAQELNEKREKARATLQEDLNEITLSEKKGLEKIKQEKNQAKEQARLEQERIEKEKEENNLLIAKKYEQQEAEIAHLTSEQNQLAIKLDTIAQQKKAAEISFAQEKKTIEENALLDFEKAQTNPELLAARRTTIEQEKNQKIAALEETFAQEMKNMENEQQVLESKKIENEKNIQAIKKEAKEALEQALQAEQEANRLQQERLEAEKKAAEDLKKLELHKQELEELQKQKDSINTQLINNKLAQAQLNSQLELLNKDLETTKNELRNADKITQIQKTKIDLLAAEKEKIEQELQTTKLDSERIRLQKEKDTIDEQQTKAAQELAQQEQAQLKSQEKQKNVVDEQQKIEDTLQDNKQKEDQLESVQKQVADNFAQAKKDLDTILQEQEQRARETVKEIEKPREHKENKEQQLTEQKTKLTIETPGGDRPIPEEKEKTGKPLLEIPFVPEEEVEPKKQVPILPIPLPTPPSASAQLIPAEKTIPSPLPPLEAPPLTLPEPIVEQAKPETSPEIPPMPLPPVLEKPSISKEQTPIHPQQPETLPKEPIAPREYKKSIEKPSREAESTIETTRHPYTSTPPEPLATLSFEPTPFPKEAYTPFQPTIPHGTWTSSAASPPTYTTRFSSESYQSPTFEPFTLSQPSLKTPQEKKGESQKKLRPSLAAKVLWERLSQSATPKITSRQLPLRTKSGDRLRSILKDLKQKSSKKGKTTLANEPTTIIQEKGNPLASFVENVTTTVKNAFNVVIDTISDYIAQLFSASS